MCRICRRLGWPPKAAARRSPEAARGRSEAEAADESATAQPAILPELLCILGAEGCVVYVVVWEGLRHLLQPAVCRPLPAPAGQPIGLLHAGVRTSPSTSSPPFPLCSLLSLRRAADQRGLHAHGHLGAQTQWSRLAMTKGAPQFSPTFPSPPSSRFLSSRSAQDSEALSGSNNIRRQLLLGCPN